MKGLRTYYAVFLWILGCFASQAQGDLSQRELTTLTRRALAIFLNNPDSAIRDSHRALKLALESGDRYYEGYCYYLLSKSYWVKANYKLSTEYGFKALKVFENSAYEKEWHASLTSLARTLSELGNYSTAANLLRRSQQIAERTSDKEMIAETYRERSYLLTESRKLDSALYYSDQGIALFESLQDTLNASILYGRKSRIYFMQKNYLKSREYAFRSMLLDSLVGNRRGLGIEYFQAAQNERALNNLALAEKLLHNSVRVNRELGNLTSLIRAHDLLAKIYLETKRPELAARELQLVSACKDSLYNSEKSGRIQEMQSLYDLETKENTIQVLSRENLLRQQEMNNQRLFLAFLLAVVLLLSVLIFFLVRLRMIQKRANQALNAKNIAIEQQKEEMQAQAEKLQQLNELKTKLFSVISHDLRGPISNLQSLLDLFTKKLLTADEFLHVSTKLKSNLNITQRTLENLLNWALTQMEGIKTHKKPVDVKACIEEACRLMEEVALKKTVDLRNEVTEAITVMADPNQLQLVLRNLIHNGIKFSKIGDMLQITAERYDNHCRVTILDCGIGMTQEEIDILSGSRAHFTKEGTQNEKGTGLGLLLCREFVERNDGTLSLKSILGEGTEVTFTLKLAEEIVPA